MKYLESDVAILAKVPVPEEPIIVARPSIGSAPGGLRASRIAVPPLRSPELQNSRALRARVPVPPPSLNPPAELFRPIPPRPKALHKPTLFVESALTETNPFMTTAGCLEWLHARRDCTRVVVEPTPFAEMQKWAANPMTGDIEHSSGKFFSITGIRVRTNWGGVAEWDQPIINQPEVGLLGILAKRFNGILYFLMQAKCEPGNVNTMQLSPTLQATKSNFTCVHQGRKPPYLEYFLNVEGHRVLVDQLQSEQGARFLRKRNRNMIIEVHQDVLVQDGYCWVTLGQIKRLLLADNVVNMNARTVISGIPFGSYDPQTLEFFANLAHPTLLAEPFRRHVFISALLGGNARHTDDEILSWFATLKARYDILVDRIPLGQVRNWVSDGYSVHHESRKYFSVFAVDVEIGNREVPRWSQPMIKTAQEGMIAFIAREIEGVLHFLVQAKIEAGHLDVVEMAPSVQCITGDYRDVPSEKRPPFLDYVLTAPPERIRYSALQSEEGGRFFREQNRNVIIEAGDEFPIDVPENYKWMTLNQLNTFIKFNNYVNIQARSLLSTICFV